jgi:hypothetical protein
MKVNYFNEDGIKLEFEFNDNDWYLAEFDSFLYYDEVMYWCYIQFGEHDEIPSIKNRWWCEPENQIRFRDEKDYIWFKLKWS